MQTVTPVNSSEAQRFEQQYLSQAYQALQTLFENLFQAQQKATKSPSNDNRDRLEIIINGQQKEPSEITWEDYGKLQALSSQPIGTKVPDLANITVNRLTENNGQINRTPLLQTNQDGTVLVNQSSAIQPNLNASSAIHVALNQSANSDFKTYLSQLNTQLNQQLQQQSQLIKEVQQLSQDVQNLQHINSQLEKQNSNIANRFNLLKQYQKISQQRDKKNPQWWQKLFNSSTQSLQTKVKNNKLLNKFSQSYHKINQWWQQRNQHFQQKRKLSQLAQNIHYFAKKAIGNQQNGYLSGTDYTLGKKDNHYQLKDKKGQVLISFDSQGLLGYAFTKTHLTPKNVQDIKNLANFKTDPLFLGKNAQFFSSFVSKDFFDPNPDENNINDNNETELTITETMEDENTDYNLSEETEPTITGSMDDENIDYNLSEETEPTITESMEDGNIENDLSDEAKPTVGQLPLIEDIDIDDVEEMLVPTSELENTSEAVIKPSTVEDDTKSTIFTPITENPTQPIETTRDVDDPQNILDGRKILDNIKYVIDNIKEDINETNYHGYHLTSSQQGQNIKVTRAHDSELIISRNNSGKFVLGNQATSQDFVNLKNLTDKAVDNLNAQITNTKKTTSKVR